MKDTITCSFTVDRELYDNYKSIVVKNHENVKGNLIRYMQRVILENDEQSRLAAYKKGMEEST